LTTHFFVQTQQKKKLFVFAKKQKNIALHLYAQIPLLLLLCTKSYQTQAF